MVVMNRPSQENMLPERQFACKREPKGSVYETTKSVVAQSRSVTNPGYAAARLTSE